MKLGAQLYTVRKQMTTPDEIKKGLKRIADIGYSCVQVSGIGKIDPCELKKICDDLSLEIAVTHTAPDRVLGDTEGVIEEHNILNCNYVGLGAMPKNYRKLENVQDFHQNFHRAIEQIAKAGKVFTYHNHAFEFEKKDGIFMIDKLFSLFDKKVMLTLDCYWANYGGVDVCDFIDKYAGRIDCVHLKDYAIKNNEIIMAPVMEGNMNYPKILEHLEKAGTKYALVEQDDCYDRDPFDCLEISYNNLKKYF